MFRESIFFKILKCASVCFFDVCPPLKANFYNATLIGSVAHHANNEYRARLSD